MKHFELTDETKVLENGVTLHRIRYTKTLGNFVKGELGGWVEKDTNIIENGCVFGNACVYGNARVSDDARVFGNAQVFGNAWVYDDARVCGDARVGNNAVLSETKDYFVFQNFGSRNGIITFYRSKEYIYVSRGCFIGTIDDFKSKVAETHEQNKYASEYKLMIELAKLKLNK